MVVGEVERRERAKRRVDGAIRDAFAEIGPNRRVRGAFEQLLEQCYWRGELLRVAACDGRAPWAAASTVVGGLHALSYFRAAWIRPVGCWRPMGDSASAKFASLARHLLARARVPGFLVPVWFEGHGGEARRHQRWFKHLGRGHSIRGVALPVRYTRRMARHFLEAPDHLSVTEAVRWGQVRGLGGGRSLAEAVARSRLGNAFEHEEYWAGVIRFLACTPEIEAGAVNAVIEYLDFHKRLPGAHSSSARRRRMARKLVQQAHAWRGEAPAVETVRVVRRLQWLPSGVPGLVHHEQQGNEARVWKIRELVGSAELAVEGATMRHCVGSYAWRCASRQTSIWSLTCTDAESAERRELTVEVCPESRRIVQALGKRNAEPSEGARRVLKVWAERVGLEVAQRV